MPAAGVEQAAAAVVGDQETEIGESHVERVRLEVQRTRSRIGSRWVGAGIGPSGKRAARKLVTASSGPVMKAVAVIESSGVSIPMEIESPDGLDEDPHFSDASGP
jgi:hypothetical protein